MKRKTANKPKRPHADYPLFPHGNGQWAKKINGRVHYFGTWEDPQGALGKYLDEKDYLINGRTAPTEATTLADVLNHFLSARALSLSKGKIVQRTYDEYEVICDKIATLGKRRDIENLSKEDFVLLREKLAKGAKGQQVAPSSVKRFVTIARGVFKFANEELGFSHRYKSSLDLPTAKQLRKAQNVERLFTPDQIRQSIDNAKPQLKAMILLGINCGFGNKDCGTLPIESLDLSKGWHRHARPKTEVARRCPLWTETAKALREVVQDRESGLVFITKYGNPWTSEGRQDAISPEFRKLVTELGFYKPQVTTFYTLRRTFETIATASGVSQPVIDAIQGHTPHSNDMGAVYRQRIFDGPLRTCTDFIQGWLDGSVLLN